jgi:hypothetical protein
MPETGINWAAYGYIDHSTGTDWNATAIADSADLTSDASVDGNFAGIEYSVVLTAGDISITGDVTVEVLGSIDGTNFEATGWELRITPAVSLSVRKRFAVSPKHYGQHKIKISNNCGDTLDTTVERRTGTVPKAS